MCTSHLVTGNRFLGRPLSASYKGYLASEVSEKIFRDATDYLP